ncbi:hypothetical protein DL93DRAFT_1086127 [Clavulina sp. PMI_390]|nr:hypothetical protein DL93DRAFT_1086127 [Clavulina sp. PMI_390]
MDGDEWLAGLHDYAIAKDTLSATTESSTSDAQEEALSGSSEQTQDQNEDAVAPFAMKLLQQWLEAYQGYASIAELEMLADVTNLTKEQITTWVENVS